MRELTKTFPEGFWRKQKKILDRVTFEVASGVTTGFVGRNGSGKTTSLKCVLGFIKAQTGQIDFFQQGSLNKKIQSKIGYLPERPYYYDFLSAEEFLHFHWQLGGGGSGFFEASQKVLSTVNLLQARSRKLRTFSKGMLQRVGMAQALLLNPDFLILDEPMSGLDPDGRLMMKEIIRDQQKKGTTVFFSSHLLGDMEELCRDVVIIDKGRILYQGSLSELAFKEKLDYRISYFSQQDSKLMEVSCPQSDLQVKIDEIRAQKGEILKVSPSSIGLEVAFTQLVQANAGDQK